MSKDFFSVIGEQLYKIKNSPFYRIGQRSNIQKQREDSMQLSYDPSRLFKPVRKQDEQQMDKQYVEFKKKQIKTQHKIQFQLLKRDMSLEYRKKIEKMEEFKTYQHNHPYTWFGVYRNACSLCQQCGQYQGNFNRSPDFAQLENPLELMECIKCRCPMNSHTKMVSQNSFYQKIWKHLQQKQVQQNHLNVDYLVAALKFSPQNNAKSSKPIKPQNHINGVRDLLAQLGFLVTQIKHQTKLNFELDLIRCYLMKDGVQKSYIESLLNLIQCIEGESDWDWKNSKLQISQGFLQQYETIKKIALGLKIMLNTHDEVYTILVKLPSNNSNDFFQYMELISNRLEPFTFIWYSKTPKQSFLSAQHFFRKYFQVNYQIFFIPSSKQPEFQKNSARFKDLLDYNQYTLVLQNIKNVERVKIQKALNKFSTAKINYILGQQLLSQYISKIGIKVAAKIGTTSLNIPFTNCPDFVTVSDRVDKARIFSHLYPQFMYSQRCIVVLRPFLIKKNFEESIINLYRINKFIIIKRIKTRIDQKQARYLAALQHIQAQKIEDYINYMTTGVIEVVLLSKRAAIYQSHILCNGCVDGPTHVLSKALKQRPVYEITRGRQKYEYEINGAPCSLSPTQHIFEGIKNAVSLQKVLFGSQQNRTMIATQASTGNVVKLDNDKNSQQGTQIKVSHKVKQTLMSSLKTDQFNYWLYSSKSQTITEELASLFVPQSTRFESFTIIVKPGYVHLIEQITKALLEHRYHIIKDKTVILSKITATELIMNLQKVKQSKEQLKQAIQEYSNQKIHIFCVSKVSGRHQMLSFLSSFTFLNRRSIIVSQFISDQALKQVLLPVWNQQQFVLRILSEPLGDRQQAIHNAKNQQLYTSAQRLDIFNYFIGDFFGVSALDLNLKTKIGRMSYYIGEFNTARLQSWFYAETSYRNPNYVPLLFQYREIGKSLLCIQSFNGYPFMTCIRNFYKSEREKLQQLGQTKRRSMTLYLWAKQLAQMMVNLSQKQTQIKNYGNIIFSRGQYQGQFTKSQIMENDLRVIALTQQKYTQLFGRSKEVEKNMKRLRQSKLLSERYEQNNRKLLPSFSLDTINQGIRVVQTEQTSKLLLIDKFSMIDPDHEKLNLRNLYTLNLFNIVPIIQTKYKTIAQLVFFFAKYQNQAIQDQQIFTELKHLLLESLMPKIDVDLFEYQIYLKFATQFVMDNQNQSSRWIKNHIKTYPALRRQYESKNQQISGKKRKFLQQKQYFVQKGVTDPQLLEQRNQQYRNFDPRQMIDPLKQTALFNPNDELHQRWHQPDSTINLLRQQKDPYAETKFIHNGKKGIYVEFQKKISENQEVIMNKIKTQAEKFHLNHGQQIIKENGLQQQLWYRRVKEGTASNHNRTSFEPKQSQSQAAIKKQIGKFLQFKKQQNDRKNAQFNQQ